MKGEGNAAGMKQTPATCPGLVRGVQVQPALEGMSSYRVLFVGMGHDQYLLAKLPLLLDIWKKLYKKNHVIIRYVHGGNIYCFRTTLIGLISAAMDRLSEHEDEFLEKFGLKMVEHFRPHQFQGLEGGEFLLVRSLGGKGVIDIRQGA